MFLKIIMNINRLVTSVTGMLETSALPNSLQVVNSMSAFS